MRAAVRTGLLYLLASLCCILFGAVYELFSHGVYSCFMVYGFLFPLVGGALPFFVLAFRGMPPPSGLSRGLHHAGIAALTAGSLFEGALDIYGTTNRLVSVYWVLGALFVLAGALLYFVCRPQPHATNMEKDDLDL